MEHAIFNGIPYGMGDGVWNYTNAPVEQDNNGPEAYGSEMRVFFMMYLMAKLNVASGPDNPITLGLSCPPGLYNQVAKKIKQGFLIGESGKRDGIWTIQLSTQNEPRHYKFKDVRVFAEGVPAFAAFCYDLNGQEVPEAEDYLGGQCHIIDLGYVTADDYVIRNGFLNPDQITHASDFNGGIRMLVIQPALDELIKQTSATHLTEVMVDSWLRHWYGLKPADRPNWIVKISGKKLRLDSIFAPLTNEYAKWVIRNKVQRAFNGGALMGGVIPAGRA